jgi:hypothetical protein
MAILSTTNKKKHLSFEGIGCFIGDGIIGELVGTESFRTGGL